MARLTTSSSIKVVVILLLMLALFGIAGAGACTVNSFKSGTYTEIGNADIRTSEVESISIDWAAGQVDVEVYEGDTVKLTEEAVGLSKAQSMRWEVKNGKLKIDYGSWLSCFSISEKKLRVQIPQSMASLEELSIDGASGSYNVSDLNCVNLKVSLASGTLHANNLDTGSTKLSAASGKFFYNGEITDSLKVDLVSGTAEVALDGFVPRNVDADITSGTCTVYLPENEGFSLKIDKVSGSFQNEFETTSPGKEELYKDGGNSHISVDMVSGKFYLKRA